MIMIQLQIRAPEEWKQQYEELLMKYQDVCSKNKMDLGRTNVARHKIVMADQTLVCCR